MTQDHDDNLMPLNLGDPVLEDKLSRALKPSAMPAGLEDRILQATVPMLKRPVVQPGSWTLRLVGHVTQVPRWAKSVAASLVLAASMGVVLTTGSILQGAHTSVTLNTLDRDLALAVAPVTQASIVRWQSKNSSSISSVQSTDIQSLSQDLDLAIDSLDKALSSPNIQLNQTPASPSDGFTI